MTNILPTMKLSQAIREGAHMHPQGNGDYVTYPEPTMKPHTCVLGAAYVGLCGTLPELGAALAIERKLGINIYDDPLIHPIAGGELSVYQVLTSLNDEHKWTREEIA